MAGRYELAALPVGTYTVTVGHPGFETLTFVEVRQVVGTTRTLNAALRVSGGEVRIEVSADSELLDRNTSAITGLIERKQADELPLNGRNWASLTAYIHRGGRRDRWRATSRGLG